MTSFNRIIVHFLSLCCLFSILSCANIKYYDQFLFVKKQGQPNLPFEKVLSFTVETKKALTLQPEIGVEGYPETFLRLESVFDENNVLIDFKKPLPVGKYKVTAYTKDTTFKVASGLTFILHANGKKVKLKPQLKDELQMK